MRAGVAKTREPKSVTAAIWRRGQWDIVGDRSDKGALEVEIIEDVVVYASELLKFELDAWNLSRRATSSSCKKGRSRMSAILWHSSACAGG